MRRQPETYEAADSFARYIAWEAQHVRTDHVDIAHRLLVRRVRGEEPDEPMTILLRVEPNPAEPGHTREYRIHREDGAALQEAAGHYEAIPMILVVTRALYLVYDATLSKHPVERLPAHSAKDEPRRANQGYWLRLPRPKMDAIKLPGKPQEDIADGK